MPAAKKPADARISSLLDNLWELSATDLLLTVGAPPMMRRDGHL